MPTKAELIKKLKSLSNTYNELVTMYQESKDDLALTEGWTEDLQKRVKNYEENNEAITKRVKFLESEEDRIKREFGKLLGQSDPTLPSCPSWEIIFSRIGDVSGREQKYKKAITEMFHKFIQ